MIVCDKQQYNSACKALIEHTTFIMPVPLTDSVHPKNSSICVLYVHDLDESISYMIPINHPDVKLNFDIPLNISKAF